MNISYSGLPHHHHHHHHTKVHFFLFHYGYRKHSWGIITHMLFPVVCRDAKVQDRDKEEVWESSGRQGGSNYESPQNLLLESKVGWEK